MILRAGRCWAGWPRRLYISRPTAQLTTGSTTQTGPAPHARLSVSLPIALLARVRAWLLRDGELLWFSVSCFDMRVPLLQVMGSAFF